MNLNTKQEILEVLTMPEETFWSQVAPAAREVCQKQFGTSLLVTAMLAYTNICKNQCLYCGMRAGNKIPRYRMSPEEILPLTQRAREDGLGRMFLLAGEDQNYGFEKLLTLIAGLRQQGYTIALGAGELSRTQYQELHDAGIHVGLEAQAALVGAESAVELAAIADVGVGLAGVVGPHNTEGEHTLGLNQTAQQVHGLILGVSRDDGVQGGQNLFHGLDELGLVAVLFLNGLNNAFDVSIHDVLAPSLIIYFYLATPGENTRVLAEEKKRILRVLSMHVKVYHVAPVNATIILKKIRRN